MLAQLDLFSSLGSQEQTPKKELFSEPRKLTPPDVVHVQKPELGKELEEVPVMELAVAQIPTAEATTSEVSRNIEVLAPKSANRGRKSIREMSLEVARIEVPADDVLYAKQYYGIGEVAVMFQVNASLLRYWESEFDILKPRKNKKGDRFFRPEDIKNLQLIHHLLREKKYTIEGAKDFLKKSKKSARQFEAIESLKKIKSFLLEIKAGLSVSSES
jgi:DNA-binding transcriptional MerR regulator